MQGRVEGSTRRIADFAIVGLIVAFAAAISPIGIRVLTGRLDLSPRVTLLSLTFDAILLLIAAAGVSWGRVRHTLFHVLVAISPLVLLAALEAGAVAFHLADRIAPLEDLSTLIYKDRWPGHFMSLARTMDRDGLHLYGPWQSDDIVINNLGLRTAPPSPKRKGEWRIAITGASVAFGWRVPDTDTIPVLMQRILHRQSFSNVTVYNFAIDGVMLADELALLKRFRDIYYIDQVIFLTGANDVMQSYLNVVAPPAGLIGGANEFELLKVVGRLKALLVAASPPLLVQLDTELLPRLARRNSLSDGLIAADAYCRASGLRCDFVLQPVLLRRKTPRGPEIRIDQTLRHVYPRYAEVFATMYGSALTTGLPVHDTSDIFDQSDEPFFIDIAHLNEAGNRRVAQWVARLASADDPIFGDRPRR